MNDVLQSVLAGQRLSDDDALAMAEFADTRALADVASVLRDQGFRNTVTYSRKVFIPLTHLCRDVCHYCTFAQVPRKVMAPYLSIDEVLEVARNGAAMGCKEALFTLGEKPELRYKAARQALAEMGYESTTDYLFAAAKAVFEETGMLAHLNPGNLEPEELARLKTVSPSMGIMLESASERLCEKGMPHYGSPDKIPAVRLQTLANAGIAAVPFTTGILIGIGETRRERIESLLAIRAIHEQYGHVQEIIVQNFRAKPETKMVNAPEPDLNELLWTVAVARLIFGPSMSVQAPPNLSPGVLPQIVHAGINDWGGVSPVTPDFVNPEAPWPHLDDLARETASAGKYLTERLTVYPDYATDLDRWAHPDLHVRMLEMIDAEGFPRIDEWCPGDVEIAPPADVMNAIVNTPKHISADISAILAKASAGEALSEGEIVRLFQSRGDDFSAVVQQADTLRANTSGNSVSFVVNRNINYTNICYFKCQFCAFSKGKLSENLRGRPYDLSDEEIARRTDEAWQRGATEVCMQGGIHPEYTGETYINIVRTVKAAQPNMHVHAFSPLEVWQGAATLGVEVADYLQQLKDVGLNTLPGTAAEILDDDVREIICADKINTEQWLQVMEAAHAIGFKTTATIMYGHVEKLEHWARHIMRVRALQERTGGFTEFVPLPFVHMEAPMYLKGKARKGPTFREAILMHSVARLALHGQIANIQTSWVKMGHEGVKACLNAGCNDLGGTLMNESISRAAGTLHGQETNPRQMANLIRRLNRDPQQRSTGYGKVSDERIKAGLAQGELLEIINTPAEKYERKTPSAQLIRNPAPRRGKSADGTGG
ncbi:MAG: 5-amino-6-(D-ribitylamino)uracil--L-tyrosine 4-hydroxyphenyl transferase CofH [Proteobacteria bacterium]|nr:5-amino-6-(D-ribitylamino)uracil--L-tyrosine 4-hydroxyphenyl transferase CofH [Pseudomonadota bacterium]